MRDIFRYERREAGFSMVITAACAVVLVSMLGLAIDASRMYILKTELQAFADAAAIAGAYELDGTREGIDRARSAAEVGPGSPANRVNFGSETVPSVDVAFSTTGTGGWAENPGNGTGFKYIRVIAAGPVVTYFLRLLPGVSESYRVPAVAFAGQLRTNVGDAVDPFSPDQLPGGNPNNSFGYTQGRYYTIKWAPPGERQQTGGMCPGDVAADYNSVYGGDRGYIDVGQGSGNSSLYNAIVNHDYIENPPPPFEIGDVIPVVEGNKNVWPALSARLNLDTDVTSTAWLEYLQSGTGNGRRILRLPVNNPDSNRVVGYATFFLPLNSCNFNSQLSGNGGGNGGGGGRGNGGRDSSGSGSGSTGLSGPNYNNNACCAEFVGTGVTIASKFLPVDQSDPTVVYAVRLFNGGQ
ncbi:MAG: hypothetical protein HYS04_18150 [Acidobacteria bacterium]|nr:hypothetical protein [Acidobacteriota bacterium]